MKLVAGAVLNGRYRVLRALGEGGLATAHLVHDAIGGRQVALKMLRDPGLAAHLRNEFAMLRGIVHPHLAQVHDFGFVRGAERTAFYTATFVHGPTLGAYASGRSWAEVVPVIAQVLDGLRTLHALDVRHGDIKPDNVIVHTNSEPASARGVLIDLSCSQRLGDLAVVVAGTPGYIAPELAAQGVADVRSDLYSVGRLLEKLMSLAPGADEQVRSLCDRLTDPLPGNRPSDVVEVLEALGLPLEQRAIPCAEPPRLIGRREHVRALEEVLERVASGVPGPRAMVLVGERGVGLTRLYTELKWLAASRFDVTEGLSSDDLALTRWSATVRDLAARDEPIVLCLDDAHQLPAHKRAAFRGLLRMLPDDGNLVVLAVDRTYVEDSSSVLIARVAPLNGEEVDAWVENHISARFIGTVLELTGGLPASLGALVNEVRAGVVSERDLRKLASRSAMAHHRIAALAELNSDSRAAVGHVAALEYLAGTTHTGVPTCLVTFASAAATAATLVHAGWLRVASGGYRLSRVAEAKEIVFALDERAQHGAFRAAARSLREGLDALPPDTPEASEQAAKLCSALCGAGAPNEARAVLDAHDGLVRSHPDPWWEPMRDVASALRDGVLLVAAANAAERAGKPQQGLDLLATALRARPAKRHRIWLAAGECHLRAGNALRAIRYLERVTTATLPVNTLARAWDATSRSLVRTSDYAGAARAARSGIALATERKLVARLQDDLGIAESYLGHFAEARSNLRSAAAIHEEIGAIRQQARTASYMALVDFRAGDTLSAARGFRQALELAKRCDAPDLLSYAAQNLGSVSHQLGDFGAALASYLEGLEIARMVGERHVEVMLSGNLAKLYVDIGLVDRAELCARRSLQAAEALELRIIVATAHAALGEVAFGRGMLDDSRTAFTCAFSLFDAEGAKREMAEVRLHLADLEHVVGDASAASEHERAAALLAEELDADDLSARLSLTTGRRLAAESDPQALDMLERAAASAERCGQRALIAEVSSVLADHAQRRGAPVLARRHRQHALELWERCGASLESGHRDQFWRHHLRADLRRDEVSPATGAGRDHRLERLLDINKKLSSSLDTKKILEWTIDSALELTGAERGFVILRRGEALELAIARNIDPARRQELAFSKGIAERVIDSGEPLVTVDAAADTRFSDQRSVHAMRLKSVLAVPIRGAANVLGALYLDHRYERGIFEQQERSLLSAFADQVAIALTNARLLEELERERATIKKLMKGQARQIDRLTVEVNAQREQLQTRYDYGNIVGDSMPMRRLFATLDRVIHVNVPVLIVGESGTGKELIARAIHYNGPRKERAMVAINCAALPSALLESELFGHIRGAFTGADRDRDGLFVAARGGTLFLDEIGDMPPAMQVKLLRVVQEREVRPVGSHRVIPIDVRLVCASHRDLDEEVASGRFREDLFYRLSVVELAVPALRDRTEDIAALAARLMQKAAETLGAPRARLSTDALRALMEHPWPGNVRELENVLTRAMLLADGGAIHADMLGLASRARATRAVDRDGFEQEEAARMIDALRASSWNVSRAARRLAIPRATFYRKMARYDISRG